MNRSQLLSTGATIPQDFKDCVRFVFFETGYEDWRHATHGGTAFIINLRGKVYGITCQHVFKDFEYGQLFITPEKFGKKGDKSAPVKGVYLPTSPRDGAVGTDILDLCVIEFGDGVDADFFKGSAYVIDANTVATSRQGDRLSVAGALKDKSRIIPPDIFAAFCHLQFGDAGISTSDPTLRYAIAEFLNPEFSSITGISGSPVFDDTANALSGMVVRGSMTGNKCQIYYLDIFDIVKALEAVYAGDQSTYYLKHPHLRG